MTIVPLRTTRAEFLDSGRIGRHTTSVEEVLAGWDAHTWSHFPRSLRTM